MLPRSILFGLLLVLSTSEAAAQVSYDQILHAAENPSNWTTYSGDYSGRRYSTLKQIDTNNVSRLTPAWAFQTQTSGKFETTPLVVDGIMYFTGLDDHGYAVDARTGRAIWRY